MTRFLAPRSMPAREVRRFLRRMRVVIAGREYKFSPWSLSIMFPAKLNDRRLYNDDKTEGISMNRFSDKSSETRFGASGCQAGAVSVCNEQSDRQRYLRHCHLSSEREWPFVVEEDTEEFDTTLLDRYNIPGRGREDELLRELAGLGDNERLFGKSRGSDSEFLRDRYAGCGRGVPCAIFGEVAEEKRESPIYDGECICLELRCRRFSASSSTKSIISSEGSLIFPLLTMRL